MDRDEFLAKTAGIEVSHYYKAGVTYYVFGPPEEPLKTVCTYRKARVFAEGIAIGRRLELEAAYPPSQEGITWERVDGGRLVPESECPF